VLTYPAPIDGIVMDKAVLAGQRFAAGETLYRIADLSSVWVLAEVFEQDLASVHIDESATVRLTAYPGRNFAGSVSFVYPRSIRRRARRRSASSWRIPMGCSSRTCTQRW